MAPNDAGMPCSGWAGHRLKHALMPCVCLAGVVNEAGTCCGGSQPTLDSSGQCCTLGLDAAGACGGAARVVDFTGRSCNGTLDAGGLCCPVPLIVDDFGICAGNSSSGVLVLTFDVLTASTQGMPRTLPCCARPLYLKRTPRTSLGGTPTHYLWPQFASISGTVSRVCLELPATSASLAGHELTSHTVLDCADSSQWPHEIFDVLGNAHLGDPCKEKSGQSVIPRECSRATRV